MQISWATHDYSGTAACCTRLSGLSLPTIQRMEASADMIHGNVDSLTKLIAALTTAGIELIGDGAPSHAGGRGVRLVK